MAVEAIVGRKALMSARRGAGRSRGCSRTSAGSPSCLLLPTVVLLGLFIAYPFVKGVLLSVTDAKVGVPGKFVGLQNFALLLNDSIFRTRSGTPSSTRRSRPSSSWRWACGLRCCSTAISGARRSPAPSSCCRSSSRPCSRPSPGSGCSIRPSASSTGRCSSSGSSRGRINWLGDPDLAHDLGDHRQYLARRAVLRDQPAGRTADHQPRAAGGRRNRRRPALAALLVRYLAAVAAGHHGGRAVLGDPDLRRLPARLCADRRRTGQRHAALRHLRLSDRRRHGSAERGRGDIARHVPGAARRRRSCSFSTSAAWRRTEP